jgi:hypothetical protein
MEMSSFYNPRNEVNAQQLLGSVDQQAAAASLNSGSLSIVRNINAPSKLLETLSVIVELVRFNADEVHRKVLSEGQNNESCAF